MFGLHEAMLDIQMFKIVHLCTTATYFLGSIFCPNFKVHTVQRRLLCCDTILHFDTISSIRINHCAPNGLNSHPYCEL